MKRGIITTAVVGMLAGWLWGATASGVTIPYVFVRDESAVVRSSARGNKRTAFIEGQFQLAVDFDAGVASFENVDATLTKVMSYYDYNEGRYLDADSLDVFFSMTELESTGVSDTQIDFLLERNIPRHPASDIRLTLTFVDNSAQLKTTLIRT